MVLFRGDIKSKSLQRRTSINVILPADNIHFLQDSEEIVPKPYKTLYLLHGLYGSDEIFLANTSIQKFAEDEEKMSTYYAPRITQIVDNYLGKGKKVNEINRDQVEQLSLIVDDLKTL